MRGSFDVLPHLGIYSCANFRGPALTASRIDAADEAIVFETLKQRKKQIFRAVPVPRALILLLTVYSVGKEERLWPWGRTNGWRIIKSVMRKAGIAESLCKPKALRHAFAVEAGQKGIPLNIVQRWLGTRVSKRRPSMPVPLVMRSEISPVARGVL